MARRQFETVRMGVARAGANFANQRVPARTVTTTVRETNLSRANRGLPPEGVQRTGGGNIAGVNDQ